MSDTTDYTDIIIDKLESLGNKYEIMNKEIRTTCLSPLHYDEKPSFFINRETAKSYCFSCHYSLNPMVFLEGKVDPEDLDKAKYNKWLRELYDMREAIEETADKKKEIFLPAVKFELFEEWRGVSPEILQKVGAYYADAGKYRGRYIFPVIEEDKVIGFDARVVNEKAIMTDAKWIRNRGFDVKSTVYPYNTLKKERPNHIILVEGVMDALSYMELGGYAIPHFGLTPPSNDRITKLLRLGVDTITFGFDNDDAGISGTIKLLPYYVEWFNIEPHPLVDKVRDSGFKDANDYLVNLKNKK